jgi:hydrogenase/urease accessory protein HupE
MHLKKVDLPQPEGPIKAVTLLAGICIEISFKAFFSP